MHPAARDEIASAVNAFVARAGISKSATAHEIGMSQSAFSRRTTGAEPFDADELGMLADYFGVTIIDLISGNVTAIAPNAKKAPTPKGEGRAKLPELDSNQQPAGNKPPAEIITLHPRKTAPERDTLAPVTLIGAARWAG